MLTRIQNDDTVEGRDPTLKHLVEMFHVLNRKGLSTHSDKLRTLASAPCIVHRNHNGQRNDGNLRLKLVFLISQSSRRFCFVLRYMVVKGSGKKCVWEEKDWQGLLIQRSRNNTDSNRSSDDSLCSSSSRFLRFASLLFQAFMKGRLALEREL